MAKTRKRRPKTNIFHQLPFDRRGRKKLRGQTRVPYCSLRTQTVQSSYIYMTIFPIIPQTRNTRVTIAELKNKKPPVQSQTNSVVVPAESI